jgi:hypothetical protein
MTITSSNQFFTSFRMSIHTSKFHELWFTRSSVRKISHSQKFSFSHSIFFTFRYKINMISPRTLWSFFVFRLYGYAINPLLYYKSEKMSTNLRSSIASYEITRMTTIDSQNSNVSIRERPKELVIMGLRYFGNVFCWFICDFWPNGNFSGMFFVDFVCFFNKMKIVR